MAVHTVTSHSFFRLLEPLEYIGCYNYTGFGLLNVLPRLTTHINGMPLVASIYSTEYIPALLSPVTIRHISPGIVYAIIYMHVPQSGRFDGPVLNATHIANCSYVQHVSNGYFHLLILTRRGGRMSRASVSPILGDWGR